MADIPSPPRLPAGRRQRGAGHRTHSHCAQPDNLPIVARRGPSLCIGQTQNHRGMARETPSRARGTGKTYVVEHLDAEMGPWSTLEYRCIADESQRAGARCYLSSVPESVQLPEELEGLPSLEVSHRSVESLFADAKAKVCLLDPAADVELSPKDGDEFEVFLFGGILGAHATPSHLCGAHWRMTDPGIGRR